MNITKINMSNAAKTCNAIRDLDADQFSEYLFECVIDSANGIFIGQRIAEYFGANMPDLAADDLAILKDTEHESYMDVWSDALEMSIISTDGENTRYRLFSGESGDVFAYNVAHLELWEELTGKDFWEELTN